MKKRTIIFNAIVFSLAVVLFGTQPGFGESKKFQPPPESIATLETQIKTYMDVLEKIRQLSFKTKVPVKTLTQEKLKEALQKSIREMDNKLKPTQGMLQLLGLLKKNEQLESYFKEFYTAQVGGMYDPDSKTFYIRADLDGIDLSSIAVHELNHALVDQYFDLNAFLKNKEVKEDSEKQIARQAVAEGEATFVMMAYMMNKMTGEKLETITQAMTEIDVSMFEGLISNTILSSMGIDIPQWLLRLLLSPYIDGLNFISYIFKKKGWEGINSLYKNPPETSEQLLHPDRYLENEPIRYDELKPLLPDVRALFTDHIGELGWRSFFQGMGQRDCAESASDGWDGDRLILYRNEGGLALFIALVFDSSQEAHEFVTCFKKAMKVREELKDTIPIEWSVRAKGDKIVITIQQKGT